MDLPPPPPAMHAPRGPCVHTASRGVPRPPADFEIRSDTHPLVGHYERPQDAAKAEALMEVLELSWTVQVDVLGFRAPEPDAVDGPELDFYLVDQDPYYAWTAGDSFIDSVDGDGYASTPAYIVFSRDIPADVLDAYAAHEFNHILQWATDFEEPSLPIWEGTATAAQTWTLGDAGAWFADVPSFQEVPGAPTLMADGYVLEPNTGVGSYFEYGSALWVMHLDAQMGGEGFAGPALWDAAASEGPNEPDVVDGAIALAGSFETLMNGIARSRWLVGERWDSRGFPEAESWGPRFTPVYEDDIPEVWDPVDLFITGQAFGTLDVSGLDGTLDIEVSSVSGLESAMLVLYDDTELSGTSVSLDVDGVDEVVIAVSNLGPPGWDADDGAYERGDQRVRWTHSVDGVEQPTAEEPRSCGCATQPKTPAFLDWLSRRR